MSTLNFRAAICVRKSFIRPDSQTEAMATTTRLRRRIKNAVCCFNGKSGRQRPSEQYRIPPREEKHRRCARDSMFVSLTKFFNRASFLTLIFTFVCTYFLFIVVFAFVIHGIALLYDRNGELCVTSFDYLPSDFKDNFLISFDLSWTTFSTVVSYEGFALWLSLVCPQSIVAFTTHALALLLFSQGYGAVGTRADDSCLVLRYVLALMAFNGVLFSGFCGATFFLKISRLHTHAYATFSSCMCLQYGEGITDAFHLHVETSHPRAASVVEMVSRRNWSIIKETEEKQKYAQQSSTESFPVLVFRLINGSAKLGGEIADASIKCMVVSVESDDEDNNLDIAEHVSIEGEQVNSGLDESRRPSPVKKKIYCKLPVTPAENPFFSKGVWYVRHVLNEKSALLKPDIRRRIAEMGSWPSDIDSHSMIRDCLTDEVQSIVVMFQGTSNLTADNVFKTVTYRREDIFIGWQFARMLYLNEDRKGSTSSAFSLEVDEELLHDIVPQEGGGNEPL